MTARAAEEVIEHAECWLRREGRGILLLPQPGQF